MITTQAEYDVAKLRTDKGLEMIKAKGGFFQAPKSWCDEYQRLAEDMLLYEIEHDLLPIG